MSKCQKKNITKSSASSISPLNSIKMKQNYFKLCPNEVNILATITYNRNDKMIQLNQIKYTYYTSMHALHFTGINMI